MTRLYARNRADDGAMLIIALAIITVVALVSAALLSLGGAKFAATASLRQVTSNGYAADAAAKIAVDNLEQGSAAPGFGGLPSTASTPWVFDNNTDGTGCFGGKDGSHGPIATSTLNLAGFYSDSQSHITKNATVTCSVVPGTGIFGFGAGAGGTGSTGGTGGSGRAVTLLGSTGGNFAAKSNNYMIHGDIASRGPIAGQDITTGKVYATSCDPSSGQAGTSCPYGGTVNDPYAGVDPNITTVPSAPGTWSGCTFQPGYYNDAVALSNAVNACGIATFSPGNYYFDFHNNSSDPTYSANTGIPNGSDVWNIYTTVVGGQRVSGVTQPPGMCKSPITNTSAQGVQFIFGGDSTMTVGHSGNNYGYVELCGSYNGGNPPIVIYGLDGSSPSRGQLAAGYATTPTQQTVTAGTVSPSGFAASPLLTPDVAALTTSGDNKTETYTTLAGSSTPSLNLSGFSPGTTIPAGSTIKSVTLNLWHQETSAGGKGNSIAPSLTYTVGSGSATNASNQPATKATLGQDSIDLSSDLGPVIAAGNLGSTSLKFTETTKGATNAIVDAAQLVITYYPPSWRGETNTAIPGNCVLPSAANQCRMIELGTSGGSNKPALVINGVTYIPAGAIGGDLSNGAQTVALRWGLVADSADFSGWPQYTFGFPLVSIPDSGPGLGSNVTAVDLKVYLCDSGTCSTSGTPALTARVLLTDPIDSSTNLISPYPNTRQVNVLSWAEQK